MTHKIKNTAIVTLHELAVILRLRLADAVLFGLVFAA